MEKERERNIDVLEKHWLVASHASQTRDLTCNPDMCPDWELNQWPFALWYDAQPIEPHRSGQVLEVSVDISWSFKILFSAMSSLVTTSLEAFFILLTVFDL